MDIDFKPDSGAKKMSMAEAVNFWDTLPKYNSVASSIEKAFSSNRATILDTLQTYQYDRGEQAYVGHGFGTGGDGIHQGAEAQRNKIAQWLLGKAPKFDPNANTKKPVNNGLAKAGKKQYDDLFACITSSTKEADARLCIGKIMDSDKVEVWRSIRGLEDEFSRKFGKGKPKKF